MVESAQSKLSLPEIGHPEIYYAALARQADEAGDVHMHEAAKVGQYVTLALDPKLPWDGKHKYFLHALRRHCSAPPFPEEPVWVFYRELSELVKEHAGAEALRLASRQDDIWAARLSMAENMEDPEAVRRDVMRDAQRFFADLLGPEDRCPEWCDGESYRQLKVLCDNWK